MDFRRDRPWVWALFLLVALAHAFSEVKTPWDSRWSLPTALSIVQEGNTDLVEYEPLVEHFDGYGIEWIDGKPYNLFPLGASLWAVPLVAVLDAGMRLTEGRSYRTELEEGRISDIEELAASLAVAWTAVLIFLCGRRLGLSRPRSLALALLLAFATPAWSTASRALWQHGPSMLCLAMALFALLRADPDAARPAGTGPRTGARTPPSPGPRTGPPRTAAWLAVAGLALGSSFVVRPTNAVFVVCLGAYVLWRHRLGAWPFAAAGLAVASLMAAHDLHLYGELLPPYYHPDRLEAGGRLGEALLGNLVSPARGLLVFTPLFLLSPVGWWRWVREGRLRGLLIATAAGVAGQWLAISGFPHWWGGHCYGPRLFSDVTPVLVLWLAPLLRDWPRRGRPGGRPLAATLVVLAALSVGINFVGANVKASLEWNVRPDNIDRHPWRLWDWSDPQFLRWHDPPAQDR